MLSDVYDLVDVRGRLEEALLNLREQRRLLSEIDSAENHDALLALLTNSLRSFCWLEDQRNGIAARIRQSPLR
jgi:hypothetical protein